MLFNITQVQVKDIKCKSTPFAYIIHLFGIILHVLISQMNILMYLSRTGRLLMTWGLTWLHFIIGWTACRWCWKPAWICNLSCSVQSGRRFLPLLIGNQDQQVKVSQDFGLQYMFPINPFLYAVVIHKMYCLDYQLTIE